MTRTWDDVLRIKTESLSKLKGLRGETTPLYKHLFKNKGVYVIRDPKQNIVYIGIAGGGEKEGGLADRLWTHMAPASALNRRLRKHGLKVEECTVAIYDEMDAMKRRRVEMYGIAVCNPPGNLD